MGRVNFGSSDEFDHGSFDGSRRSHDDEKEPPAGEVN
jgi:hypothetical protein